MLIPTNCKRFSDLTNGAKAVIKRQTINEMRVESRKIINEQIMEIEHGGSDKFVVEPSIHIDTRMQVWTRIMSSTGNELVMSERVMNTFDMLMLSMKVSGVI